MKQRCTNPKNKDYKWYGARGITVCDRWLESYGNFLQDMGPCPEGMTLERVKNGEGYSKSNCVWATHQTQHRNRRGNLVIEIDGVSKCLVAWAEHYKLNYQSVKTRVRRGWDIKRALEIVQ